MASISHGAKHNSLISSTGLPMEKLTVYKYKYYYYDPNKSISYINAFKNEFHWFWTLLITKHYNTGNSEKPVVQSHGSHTHKYSIDTVKTVEFGGF